MIALGKKVYMFGGFGREIFDELRVLNIER
jgi:hypothetical protein